MGPYIRIVSAAGQGGAAVLPLVGKKVVLVRHERHATRQFHWEIPRGFAAQGEQPEETAEREVAEELGITRPEVVAIGSVHPDTGASNVLTHLYIAYLSGIGRGEVMEGIDEITTVSMEEFYEMLRSGQITDSFTLAAVLHAQARGYLSQVRQDH